MQPRPHLGLLGGVGPAGTEALTRPLALPARGRSTQLAATEATARPAREPQPLQSVAPSPAALHPPTPLSMLRSGSWTGAPEPRFKDVEQSGDGVRAAGPLPLVGSSGESHLDICHQQPPSIRPRPPRPPHTPTHILSCSTSFFASPSFLVEAFKENTIARK